MNNLKKVIIFIVIIFLLIFIIKIFNIENVILQKIYPLEYKSQVEEYAEKYEVDKFIIYAIIKQESNFDINAHSASGAKGLMQIMDGTAEDIAKNLETYKNEEINLYDPETNIMFGTKYFSDLLKEYNNQNLALAAYNAGTGNVKKWIENGTIDGNGDNIENIPFKETNLYIRKILQNYKIYQNLYNKER